MTPDEVTEQIMDAWDEIQAEEEGEPPTATAVPVEEPDEPEEDEESKENEEPEGDEAEEDTEDEEAEEEEEEPEVAAEAPQFEDVEIQAFLSKYNGDVEKALKGAAELQRLMGRRDEEKVGLTQQIDQLRGQLTQMQAFGGGTFLTPEQQMWVETAAESANPGGYVQQALQAGEYELARAICREWATENPLEAVRAAQVVDSYEAQVAQQQAAPAHVPPAQTWQALAENYPELKTYEQQMVQTLERLGPEHPLVQEARSTDPMQAVRGLFGLYEIAKASTFAITETKNGLKKRRRQEADDAVGNAAVTSAAATPSGAGTPRNRKLMPGLSREDFDSAFDAEFARQ